MPRVFGLVLKVAWQFRVISTRGWHLQNSLTKRNFKAVSWISKQEFARRRRIPRLLCRAKSLKDLISPKSITGKEFSDYEELDLMMTAELKWSYDIVFLIYEFTERKNSHTERKTEECFQRKTIGSCSRRDACSFLHTHGTGDREDNVEWSGDTQEILT